MDTTSDKVKDDNASKHLEQPVPGRVPALDHDTSQDKTTITSRTELIQLAAIYWSLFMLGYNDASLGPLIPRMQEYYNISYTIVSLVFIFACLGAMSGAVSLIWYNQHLGFGKTLLVSAVLNTVAYSFISVAPPFPAFVFGYFINLHGGAIQDSMGNGFVASIPNSATKMGLLHASYGVGALVAPLSSTQFAQEPGKHWAFHYLTLLGLSVINLVVLGVVFRGRSQKACLADDGIATAEEETSEHSHFGQIMRLRAVHFLGFFLFAYVGVEVCIGGWIVTFIIKERGGGPSSGYVSSGFWGGLAAGRVLLLPVNKAFGEHRAVYVYTILAMALDIVIWRVRNLIGDAIAVSFIGFFLGPLYPIAINRAGAIIPPWLLNGSVGWAAAFGQAGSAIWPFATGTIANEKGIGTLQPLVLALMLLMLIFWAMLLTVKPPVLNAGELTTAQTTVPKPTVDQTMDPEKA